MHVVLFYSYFESAIIEIFPNLGLQFRPYYHVCFRSRLPGSLAAYCIPGEKEVCLAFSNAWHATSWRLRSPVGHLISGLDVDNNIGWFSRFGGWRRRSS